MKGTALRFSGYCHERLGNLPKALEFYQQAVEYFRRRGYTLEEAETQAGLGWTLHKLYRDDEALEEFNAALKVLIPAARNEKPADHIHDNWANALQGIARVHERAGRYDLAEPYKRQALNVMTAARGWKHPQVALAAASLAETYFTQGRYAEAEPLYVAAIEAYKATSGFDNLSALATLNNLSRMLAVEGRYADAEATLRFVVEHARELGDPNLAAKLANMANTLFSQDKYEEAEPFAREAVKLAEEQPNPVSRTTADAVRTLAAIRHVRGDDEEALALCDRAIELYEQAPLGPGYVGTVWAQRALTLWSLGASRKPTKPSKRPFRVSSCKGLTPPEANANGPRPSATSTGSTTPC